MESVGITGRNRLSLLGRNSSPDHLRTELTVFVGTIVSRVSREHRWSASALMKSTPRSRSTPCRTRPGFLRSDRSRALP
eukprot:6052823-Pyramimonas_sp.AAC.1